MKPLENMVAENSHPVEAVNSLDVDKIKRDFPIFSRKVNGYRLNYLDSAATSQKPIAVTDAYIKYYDNFNANVHRGLHTLAEEATSAFEATRDRVAEFIGGVKREEIIYTRGTTESINTVVQSWGRANIKRGDRIVITQMEHHANLVPWIMLAKETGAELEYIPIDADGYLKLDNIDSIISPNTKLVAVTQMSNVLGTINPVGELIDLAHQRGAVALIDGAQSVPHMPIDVKALNADFLAFSAHKMLGPTGLGILYGKEHLLEQMPPVQFGGEMISKVTFDYADWAELPWKFEAGTPNIAAAVAFKPALDYLEKLGMENIREHEIELTGYALEKLSKLDFVKIFGPMNPLDRGGAISFLVDGVHTHDVAQFLDSRGIAVRSGHHCAQPLMRLLGVVATSRASLYIYNTPEDIDELAEALREARRYFLNV